MASVSISMLVVASWRLSSSVSSAFRFLFLDLTFFMAVNIPSHRDMLPYIARIFSVKSFSFGNLSLLTNFKNSSSLGFRFFLIGKMGRLDTGGGRTEILVAVSPY